MNWQELKDTELDAILEWAEDQSWSQAMADCPQDAEWHAEGDVWTHTKMVCRQLSELQEWPSLTDHDRIVLIFTALFHDAAKPLTSRLDPSTGRVTSPKHAIKGEHLARGVLRQLECDLVTREQIAKLVRYHGRPVFLTERVEPTHEVARMSWLVENRLLYLFALADNRGRDPDSLSRPEENLHFWKLQAEELGCFDQPYPFANDHARFTFFRQQEPNLYYVPYEDFCCDVTMVCGLPGSGKDTWLTRNRPELPVLSLDEIRRELGIEPTANQGEVVQLASERCRECMRSKTSFAFNATNILKQTRQRWIDLFADYNARIELVYLEPPFDKLLSQNKSRTYAVPEDVIKNLATKYEPPTWTEGHRLIMCDGS